LCRVAVELYFDKVFLNKEQSTMFEIKCPECKVNSKGLLRDYVQWRSDRQICPRCGAQLEISNAILCFGLCGLIFGIIVGSSHYWAFGNACPPFVWREWLRLVIAVLICWMVLPIVVRAVGRWRVVSSEQKAAAGIQKWSRFVPLSILALAIVFGITYCIVRITFVVIGKWLLVNGNL